MQIRNYLIVLLLCCGNASASLAQDSLSLKQAVAIAAEHYGTVKAKANYAAASREQISQAKREYLPNFNLSAQQDYGTVNGQNGPLYGFGGLSASSSGIPLDHQSWNAAFGALYLTNVNWDFFAFGRAKEKIKTAEATAARDSKDWEQELFRHKVKVAAAYLNLLAAQQLRRSYEKNLERADTFKHIVTVRALNGLIAGVDSAQANAELSNARITLIKARDIEQEQSNQLAQLMGVPPHDFILDTFFMARFPAIAQDSIPMVNHPVLQWYKSRISLSNEQERYYKTLYYPAFSLVGVLQTRGSGFNSGYTTNQNDYSQGYWDGIHPTRTNYLFGLGVTWNITQPLRIARQVKAQRFISKGLEDEYELASQQVRAQLQLSDTKIKNALASYSEVPVQVRAASNAYIQKSVLYKNGLTNLIDVTQALYVLIRAETDRDIANNNIWQALLLKAAAAGDFNLFESQL